MASLLADLDARAARGLNAAACRQRAVLLGVAWAARWLAGAEIGLMAALGVRGGPGTVGRMLGAVGTVYVVCAALGAIWPRQRPFTALAGVHGLGRHSIGRSFPSRHTASALAMAVVAGGASRRLARAMGTLGWLLGLSRVAAGLHYPSDVLAGALLGGLAGRAWRRR